MASDIKLPVCMEFVDSIFVGCFILLNMPITKVFPRRSTSESFKDTVLDIMVIVSVSILCALLVAVGITHCITRYRNRQRSNPNWTSQCQALNMISSSSQSSGFPKDGDYLVYEVELTPNYHNGNTAGKNWVFSHEYEKDPPNNENKEERQYIDWEVEPKCTHAHLLVPIPASPVYLPPKV
ncbi:hypothetical protein CPB84DRAFT_797730 [Gymnopilus junonius]|uniref:Uncharacterized protein n=1 Tax=Gymnopilus junonius TaxID=109634 RepID=A0A9P5TPN9_GYMJU|nr:hypothetical protein CPB84DRAFT_797730 [Gymnopilus junonius]